MHEYNPTQAEIRTATKEIRSHWSREERRRRKGLSAFPGVRIRMASTSFIPYEDLGGDAYKWPYLTGMELRELERKLNPPEEVQPVVEPLTDPVEHFEAEVVEFGD